MTPKKTSRRKAPAAAQAPPVDSEFDIRHPPGWSKPKHEKRNADECRNYIVDLAEYFAEMKKIVDDAAKVLESITDKEARIKPSTAGVESALKKAKEKLVAAFEDKAKDEFDRFEAREKVRERKAKAKKS